MSKKCIWYSAARRARSFFFVIKKVCFYCWFAVKCILICKTSKHICFAATFFETKPKHHPATISSAAGDYHRSLSSYEADQLKNFTTYGRFSWKFDHLNIQTGQTMEAGKPGKRVYRLVLTGGMYCQNYVVSRYSLAEIFTFSLNLPCGRSCRMHYISPTSHTRRQVTDMWVLFVYR